MSEVDNFVPIKGTEKEFEIDTLLLSVGLIPENGISEDCGIKIDSKTKGPIVNESYQTNIPGIFACGNVLHVHDLVDFVTEESRKTGLSVVKYLNNDLDNTSDIISLKAGTGVSYIVPQFINPNNIDKSIELFLRVKKVFKNVTFSIESNGTIIKTIKKKHLAPAEMEKVKLTIDNISNVSKQITISVEV